jgi:hypothetical protein
MVTFQTEIPAAGERARNRFEIVPDIQPDAISYIIEQSAAGPRARVFCPASALPEEAGAQDRESETMTPEAALSAAIKLANELKLAIVVIDKDGIWNKDWGDLYRWEDEAEAGGDDRT